MLFLNRCKFDINQLTLQQRLSTPRGEKGGGRRFFSQIEPTVTNPCRTVPCEYHCWGMPGRRAGSPIAEYARVQCWEPKTGQQKVRFYCEDDSLCRSCFIIYLCSTVLSNIHQPFSLILHPLFLYRNAGLWSHLETQNLQLVCPQCGKQDGVWLATSIHAWPAWK